MEWVGFRLNKILVCVWLIYHTIYCEKCDSGMSFSSDSFSLISATWVDVMQKLLNSRHVHFINIAFQGSSKMFHLKVSLAEHRIGQWFRVKTLCDLIRVLSHWLYSPLLNRRHVSTIWQDSIFAWCFLLHPGWSLERLMCLLLHPGFRLVAAYCK